MTIGKHRKAGEEKFTPVLILIVHVILLMIVYSLFAVMGVNRNAENVIIAVALSLSLWCMITWRIVDRRWDSAYMLFLVFYVIYLYGQISARVLFGYSNPMSFEVIDYFSTASINQACILSIYCMAGLHIGALLYSVFKYSGYTCQKNVISVNSDRHEDDAIRITAWILTIASMVPALKLFLSKLQLAGLGGYREVYSAVYYGIDSIGNKLESYFVIGLLMLLGAYRSRPYTRKLIFAVGFGYSAIKIMFGARGIPLLEAFAFIWMWHKTVIPISGVSVLLGVIGLIPVSALLALIKVMRALPLMEWLSDLPRLVTKTVTMHPLLQVINEMGTAIGPTAASIEFVPRILPFGYGLNYLYAVVLILPSLGKSGPHWALEYADVQSKIAGVPGVSFGGSIVAEAYYNFGWFAWIFMIFVGVLIAIFSTWANNTQNVVLLALSSYGMSILLWTIRNTLITIPRGFVYYAVFPYVIYVVIKALLRRKGCQKDI